MGQTKINVEVAYASPTTQKILSVEVEEGSTIESAIDRSGILELFPEIDLGKQKVGIFSKLKSLDEKVKAGDRIEIYRPLTLDPKDARRKRAKQK
jgi:putative ubiquitin-RnfH superfamily antitoxin RatB of RatAB toxin-antitoxin module